MIEEKVTECCRPFYGKNGRPTVERAVERDLARLARGCGTRLWVTRVRWQRKAPSNLGILHLNAPFQP